MVAISDTSIDPIALRRAFGTFVTGVTIITTRDADGTPRGGYKTLVNSGPDGGQEVYHLHLHMYGGARPWPGQR